MNSSPWAKLTTSMMPKISVNPEATSARIMPLTMPLIVWMMICSSILDSHILVDDRVVHAQLGSRGVVPDDALLHDVDPLAGLERQRDVLLDQQDRHVLLMQHIDDVADLGDHARHQAFRRLVQQDDLRLEHHRAGDGQHLLLAARERPSRLTAALGEDREVVIDLVEELLLPSLGHSAAIKAGAEILGDRQQAEDAPVLG